MRTEFAVAGLVGAVLIIAIIQFWPGDESPAAPPAPEPATEQGEPSVPADVIRDTDSGSVAPVLPRADTAVEEPQAPLPALARSDPWVRDELEDWALPANLLERESLLPRLAVVMQNAAEGKVPRRQVTFLTPAERLTVTRIDDERFLLDPVSYRRYDVYMDLLERVPPAELARFLDRAEPLLTAALSQLGETRTPAQLLRDALARIDALPDLPAQVELLQPKVVYVYADPALEQRSDLDKQLLRMGPRNISRLRSYLIEFNDFYFQD